MSRIKGESKVSSYYSKLKNNLQVPKLEQISLVQAALLKFPIPKIEIQNLIKKPIVEISLYKIEDNKTVEILEPLTVPAEIHNPILVVGKVNIDFLGNFAVKIEYPGKFFTLVKVESCDIVREGSMFYTIRKNILLVRPPSDEYPINFSFVQGVEPEMDSDYKIMQSGKMSHYSHVGDQVVCDSGTVWIEIPAKARCTALFKFRRVLVKK